MPRELRNIGASVRARLLDRARAERSDFQILLTRYALERLAAAPDAFAVTVADLRAFLMPLVVAMKEERIWPPNGPWSPIDEA
jgi:hypothetical protein